MLNSEVIQAYKSHSAIKRGMLIAKVIRENVGLGS